MRAGDATAPSSPPGPVRKDVLVARRLRIVLFGCLGATLVGAVVWFAYAGLFAHAQDRDVAVPSDDASAEQVVTAFVDALDAHDCDTAARLVTPGAKASAESWCNGVAEMDDVRTRAALRENPRWSGLAPPQQVVRVPVRFDLDWRWMRSDRSMPEGRTDWGYLLVRDSDAAPWRIFDQGMG